MINVPLHEDSELTCKSNHEAPFPSALHTNYNLIREAGLKHFYVVWSHKLLPQGEAGQEKNNKGIEIQGRISGLHNMSEKQVMREKKHVHYLCRGEK